jgi:hypothetical protein
MKTDRHIHLIFENGHHYRIPVSGIMELLEKFPESKARRDWDDENALEFILSDMYHDFTWGDIKHMAERLPQDQTPIPDETPIASQQAMAWLEGSDWRNDGPFSGHRLDDDAKPLTYRRP